MIKAEREISGSLERDGYCHISNLLAPLELATIKRHADPILSMPPHPGMSRPGNDLSALRWNDPIVLNALTSATFIQAVRQASAATDLKWLSGYLSSKQPHSPALAWHQDWWCWDHSISFERQAAQLAVLVYLTQTTTENGALRLLPRSHRCCVPLHAEILEPHSAAANSLPNEHLTMRNAPGQITFEVEPGDAVVIDYRLLHGTHPNQSSSRRDCLLLSFIPHWSGLPTEIKAHLSNHPALPTSDEFAAIKDQAIADVLPTFSGVGRDLSINRRAPSIF